MTDSDLRLLFVLFVTARHNCWKTLEMDQRQTQCDTNSRLHGLPLQSAVCPSCQMEVTNIWSNLISLSCSLFFLVWNEALCEIKNWSRTVFFFVFCLWEKSLFQLDRDERLWWCSVPPWQSQKGVGRAVPLSGYPMRGHHSRSQSTHFTETLYIQPVTKHLFYLCYSLWFVEKGKKERDYTKKCKEWGGKS